MECDRTLETGAISRAACLPKIGHGPTFAPANAFIEKLTVREQCPSCSSQTYTLSVGIVDEIVNGWVGIHAYGCRVAEIANAARSKNGKKDIPADKRWHYLGSYIITVEEVANANSVLKVSSVKVKRWPTANFDEHANICLDFRDDADDLGNNLDRLALADFLVKKARDKQQHICACDAHLADELMKLSI